MITPKLAESVQRSLRLKELFHQRRYSENSMWGTISLAELLNALEAESINLNDIKLTFSENVLDAITLPSGGVAELTLDSEDKSLLNDHWFYTDVLDDCLEFEQCGHPILEYRFMFGSGWRIFKCKDKTADDFREFIANFPNEVPYSIVEVFEDHPSSLCTRYTLTKLGLYNVVINFKNGCLV